jgi:hypothetical protein
MARLSQWQPYTHYVQAGMVDGQFMNASFCLIAAGPPRLSNIGGMTLIGAAAQEGAGDDIVFPIGIVASAAVEHWGHDAHWRCGPRGGWRRYRVPHRHRGELQSFAQSAVQPSVGDW